MTNVSKPNLLAMHTLHSELLLVAGHTVVEVVLRDEALGANRLLTPLTGEAGLMPAVALVLHLPGAWERKKGREGKIMNR